MDMAHFLIDLNQLKATSIRMRSDKNYWLRRKLIQIAALDLESSGRNHNYGWTTNPYRVYIKGCGSWSIDSVSGFRCGSSESHLRVYRWTYADGSVHDEPVDRKQIKFNLTHSIRDGLSGVRIMAAYYENINHRTVRSVQNFMSP